MKNVSEKIFFEKNLKEGRKWPCLLKYLPFALSRPKQKSASNVLLSRHDSTYRLNQSIIATKQQNPLGNWI